MKITKLPETLTREKIEALRKAFGYFYEDGQSKNFTDPETGFHFNSVVDFVDYLNSPEIGIPKGTSAKHIGITLENWYETLEVPEYKAESNTLTPNQLAQFEEEEKTRSEQIQQTRVESSEAVGAAIKQKQKIYQEQIKRAEAAKVKLEKAERYAKVETPEMSPDQQKQVEILTQNAKANPQETVKVVSQEIKNRLGNAIPQEAIDLTALNIVANLQTGYAPIVQSAVTDSVIKDPQKLGQTDVSWTSPLSDQSKSLQDLTKEITKTAFGKEFQEAVLPSEIVISETPEQGYAPVSLAYLPQKAVEVINQKNDVLENPSLKSTDWANKWTGSQIAILKSDGSVIRENVSFSSFRPQGNVNWEEIGGQTKLNFATGVSEPLNLIGGLAKKAGTKVVTKAATAIATKTGIKAAFSKITAALGSAGGPIGTFLGWVAGEFIGKIADKINWKEVKKWSAAIVGGLAGLISLPFVGLGAAVGIGLGTTAISMGIGGSLGGLTLGGIGSGIVGLFGAIGGATLGAIAGPILFILLGFPVIVAFILFIINSGAYVVPPSTRSSLLGYDNPYISVTKTANPDKIGNGHQTVTYTVTITALRSPLTNLKIVSTDCSVIKKNKAQVGCPAENVPDLPSDLSISPASPYTFTFTSDFGSNLSDSLVSDSVEISADSPEEQGITTSGSETVCVGDCPTSCVKVVDNADPWPGNARSNAEKAALTLAGKYPGLAAKYCSAGEVNLCYRPGVVDLYGWHVHNQFGDNCDIYFKAGGLNSEANSLFMLGHELTHHIQRISGAESEYHQSGAPKELPLCSYGASTSESEGMAEAVGLYASIPSWGGCVGNYKNKYPRNYIFAKGFME